MQERLTREIDSSGENFRVDVAEEMGGEGRAATSNMSSAGGGGGI
jgi:hypothetical protein